MKQTMLRRSVWWLGAAGAYTGVYLVARRGSLPVFAESVLGDPLDAWQGLWNLWWWRHWNEFGHTLFRTEVLWWPVGTPLWFQTWNIPAAIVAWPLWGWLSGPAIYNLLVAATFPASGMAMFAFCRSAMGVDNGPAFLAGCLYTYSTFHFAHADANLHLASMEWGAVYFLCAHLAALSSRLHWAVLSGLALSLAAMTSAYYGLFCVVGTAVIWLAGGYASAVPSPSLVRQIAASAATFLAVTGWLVWGMLSNARHEPYVGNHDPLLFSADLQSFFVPGAVSVWRDSFDSWKQWTIRPSEASTYVGYVPLLLGTVASLLARKARPYYILALVGMLLALGPLLKVGGQLTAIRLPEGWLEVVLPGMSLAGIPARFVWLTTFGLAAASSIVLNLLWSNGRFARITATLIVVLSLCETWPRVLEVRLSTPVPLFEEWARDTTADWAVLDATPGSWPLQNQMEHRRPILAGYLSRTPRALAAGLRDDPRLSPLFLPPVGRPGPWKVPIAEVVAAMRERNVHYVVIEAQRSRLLDALSCRVVYAGPQLTICDVTDILVP